MAEAFNNVWGCCALQEGSADDVNCTSCLKTYHLACISVADSVIKIQSWKCPNCVCSAPKRCSNDNTPVRFNPNITVRTSKRQALSSPPNNNMTQPITHDDVRAIMSDVLKSHMADFAKEINRSIRGILDVELKSIKDDFKDIKDSMNFMNETFETIQKEHKVTLVNVKKIEEKSESMLSTIMSLQSRINQLEQNSRANNIEIQCLPEKKSENLITLIKKLGSVIECDVSEQHITRITRIAKMQQTSPRPRSIVVEFKDANLRDAFLAANINFNKKHPKDKLNSSHIGFVGKETPIYIAEHLSVANKVLHAAARKTAKEKDFKFVWVRGGKIYLRKNEDSSYIIVRDLQTLDNLK
jgi:hypothetical protein